MSDPINDSADDLRVENAVPSILEMSFIVAGTGIILILCIGVFAIAGRFIDLQKEFYLLEGCIVIPPVLYLALNGYSLRAVFRLRGISLPGLLTSVFGGFFLILAINYIENLVNLLPLPEQFADWKETMGAELYGLLTFDSMYDAFILTAAIVALAPVAEEMFFRGLIQTPLDRKFGAAAAVAVSSVLFTALHPLSLLPILLLAVYLGTVTALTGSLIPAVLIHALNNGLSLAALNLSGDIREDPAAGIGIPFSLFLFSLLMCIFSLRILLMQTRIRSGETDETVR